MAHDRNLLDSFVLDQIEADDASTLGPSLLVTKTLTSDKDDKRRFAANVPGLANRLAATGDRRQISP